MPLWPPKPKLFESVGPGSHGRASPMTRSVVISGSTSVVPAVGGMRRFSNDEQDGDGLDGAGRRRARGR